MKKIFLSAALCIFLAACSDDKGRESTETSEKKEDSTKANSINDDDDIESEETPQTLNGIEINTKGGVKVNRAYLVYADDESLVPSSNKTTIGRAVKLILQVDGGWKEENGEIAIGASEIIETSEGHLVLNSGDMFEQYKTLKAEYGNIITLKATITEMTTKYDHFVVSFKVWDKKGDGEITGKYKLYIAE